MIELACDLCKKTKTIGLFERRRYFEDDPTCTKCNGSGKMKVEEKVTCPDCGGAGHYFSSYD